MSLKDRWTQIRALREIVRTLKKAGKGDEQAIKEVVFLVVSFLLRKARSERLVKALTIFRDTLDPDGDGRVEGVNEG